jgi:hypothetical protein
VGGDERDLVGCDAELGYGTGVGPRVWLERADGVHTEEPVEAVGEPGGFEGPPTALGAAVGQGREAKTCAAKEIECGGGVGEGVEVRRTFGGDIHQTGIQSGSGDLELDRGAQMVGERPVRADQGVDHRRLDGALKHLQAQLRPAPGLAEARRVRERAVDIEQDDHSTKDAKRVGVPPARGAGRLGGVAFLGSRMRPIVLGR